MNLKTLINNNKNQFDRQFKILLKSRLNNSILSKAMYYGSINGGKRIRPFLVGLSSKIAKISFKNSFILSSSIECIHSYSLIHDDLPCMDDDDYRRGRLSTHKKFNESVAILAGDALHDLAYELLSNDLKVSDTRLILKIINYLSYSIGNKGLALGQSLDLEYEKKNINKKKILKMYSNKTGKLFEYSFCSPFILANSSINKIKFAKEYGQLFGLIFQIVDDIIDEIGTLKKIGKTPGKDYKQGKSTLLSVMGKNKVIKFCNDEINSFEIKYRSHLKDNKLLIDLLYFSLNRVT